MKILFVFFFIPLVFLFSSCVALDDIEDQREMWEEEMFDRHYYTDDQQVTAIFEDMIQIIETQDYVAMMNIFAKNTVATLGDLENDIAALFNAYRGKLVSFQLLGPVTGGSKDGDKYTKNIDAVFDITTTDDIFRIAFRVYTIDSHTPDNLGIHSVYLVKPEGGELRIADWNIGINIESSLLKA